MIALILELRSRLGMWVVALICFLMAFLFSRGPTVVRSRCSRILSPDLTQGVFGQALNFVNLGSVWQSLLEYGCLGQVD